jgi:hypothetical protein
VAVWAVPADALVIFGVLSAHRGIVVLGSVLSAGCVVGLLWSSRSPQPIAHQADGGEKPYA